MTKPFTEDTLPDVWYLLIDLKVFNKVYEAIPVELQVEFQATMVKLDSELHESSLNAQRYCAETRLKLDKASDRVVTLIAELGAAEARVSELTNQPSPF